MFEAMMQNGSALFFGMILLFLLCFALVIFLTVFWVLMIIDCAKRKMSDSERVVWILVLVFLGFIGATIYYFAVKRK